MKDEEQEWDTAKKVLTTIDERNLIRLLAHSLSTRDKNELLKDSGSFCLGKFATFGEDDYKETRLMATAMPTPVNFDIGAASETERSIFWGQCEKCNLVLSSFGDEAICPSCSTITVLPEEDPE